MSTRASDTDQNPSAPAGGELSKQYRPIEHEERIFSGWERSGVFHADPTRVLSGRAKAYVVLIPPPNVTDRLHLGHALNNTLQDVLVRAHRMMGYEALWMPGTDHAGIATQAVIEKRLRASGELKGPLRESMTRDAFVAKAQAFKDEYEGIITGQLKRMGCSCDWARQRFTMDPVCARAVREAFFRFFQDGLISRGKRLVNWDPVLQTAVADDECFDEEVEGAFYYLRYPLVRSARARAGMGEGEDPQPVTWDELARRGYPEAERHGGSEAAWVTVATTRPETYLGDTAVAVNPHDPRARALRGLYAELPLIGRVVPIVEDSYVVLPERYARSEEEKADPKAKMATGFLKVTPAHDPNDYELGQRHTGAIEAAGNPVLVNVMAPDGSISDRHGWGVERETRGVREVLGKSREDARKWVVAEFKSRGLLEGVKPHRHSVKHSDRSKAIIEPYLSDQWYLKVTDGRLAGSANEALRRGELRFHPARYARTYELWHEGIRDWCISRQLWWGHRIPVWSLREGRSASDGLARRIAAWEAADRVSAGRRGEGIDVREVCVREEGDLEVVGAMEAEGFERDPDVLDTWFSSALWPLSTLGWPDGARAAQDTGVADFPRLLEAFNPTSTLCTAREIITLWVSRMVMFNRYFAGEGMGRGPVPFRDVFIHAVIQDGHGQKMSKSLGNGVDPLDIIATHGADAMRFTLCHMSTQTQDVRMPVDLICPHTGEVFTPKFVTNKDGYVVAAPVQESPRDASKRMVTAYGVASGEARATAEMPLAKSTSAKFDLGRNFANKLWNAARYALGILGPGGGAVAPAGPRPLMDRWMLSRLEAGVAGAERALREYDFASYATAVYDLLWRDFCDWYLEGIKPTVGGDAGQRAVLAAALEGIVRVLHPIMPYVTETIYERVREVRAGSVEGVTLSPPRKGVMLATAGWPVVSPDLHDAEAEARFEDVRSLVTAIRDVRASQQVPPKRRITLHVPRSVTVWEDAASLIRTFAGVETITREAVPGGVPGVAFTCAGAEYRVSGLREEGAGDVEVEKARVRKQIADKEKSVATLEGRLANPGYAERAPAAMVQQTRDQLAQAKTELAALRTAMEQLGG